MRGGWSKRSGFLNEACTSVSLFEIKQNAGFGLLPKIYFIRTSVLEPDKYIFKFHSFYSWKPLEQMNLSCSFQLWCFSLSTILWMLVRQYNLKTLIKQYIFTFKHSMHVCIWQRQNREGRRRQEEERGEKRSHLCNRHCARCWRWINGIIEIISCSQLI